MAYSEIELKQIKDTLLGQVQQNLDVFSNNMQAEIDELVKKERIALINHWEKTFDNLVAFLAQSDDTMRNDNRQK